MSDHFQQVRFSPRLVDGSILCFWTLFTHGLLLLNDGVYWDDWILYIDLLRHNWASLHRFDRELGGLPVGYWLTWLLGHLPSTVLMFKSLFFCSILLCGLLVYRLCEEFGLNHRIQQLFISLVVISYPAFKMTISMAAGPYWVWYVFFLLGCTVATRAAKTKTRFRYVLRFLSYGIFAIAFRVNSFLVYYFGFLFILALLEDGRIGRFSLSRATNRIVTRYFDYLCYPFVYFVAIKKLFPSMQVYSTYNSLFSDFTLRKYLGCYFYFFMNSVVGQFREAVSIVLLHPFAITLFALCVFLLYSFIFNGNRGYGERILQRKSLFFYGCFLFFLAAFPYAAVLKFPSETGTDSRHALLTGLPMGIILFSVVCTRSGRVRTLGGVMLCGLLVLMSCTCIRNYLFWQAHWIKDRSTLYHLSQTKKPDISVFWIRDEFIIPETEPWHQYYAYSSMFRYAWGGDSRIGLDVRDKDFYSKWMHKEGKEFFRIDRYNLRGFNPDGPQMLLVIREGPVVEEYGLFGMTWRYWYYKFRSDSMLEQFLAGVTQIEFCSA